MRPVSVDGGGDEIYVVVDGDEEGQLRLDDWIGQQYHGTAIVINGRAERSLRASVRVIGLPFAPLGQCESC